MPRKREIGWRCGGGSSEFCLSAECPEATKPQYHRQWQQGRESVQTKIKIFVEENDFECLKRRERKRYRIKPVTMLTNYDDTEKILHYSLRKMCAAISNDTKEIASNLFQH